MFDDMFDVDVDPLEDCPDDELEDFLALPPETKSTCPDPIKWWHEKRVKYPRVSRMALDYLTIPGTYYSEL